MDNRLKLTIQRFRKYHDILLEKNEKLIDIGSFAAQGFCQNNTSGNMLAAVSVNEDGFSELLRNVASF
jgi:hypothetical protein